MVLVECAYMPFGVLVRSVVRGMFGVGVDVEVFSGGGVHWDVGRVLFCGVCVGMGIAYT
jgi:hypothetical protein